MNSLKKIFKKFKALGARKKAIYTTKISIIFSGVMAFGKISIGLFTLSVFFIVSGGYSLGIGLCKLIYLLNEKNLKNNVHDERKSYFLIVIILLMTSVLYIIYMVRLFFVPSLLSFDLIPSIAIAFISFLELALAICGLIKSKKKKDLLLMGLKNVNLTSALTSIVLTQIAILSATNESGENLSKYNAVAGIVFGGLCILVILHMLYRFYCPKAEHLTLTHKKKNCCNCGKKIEKSARGCIHCGVLFDELETEDQLYDYCIINCVSVHKLDIISYFSNNAWELNELTVDIGINKTRLCFRRPKKIERKRELCIQDSRIMKTIITINKLERNRIAIPLTLTCLCIICGITFIISGALLSILMLGSLFTVLGIVLSVLGVTLFGLAFLVFKRTYTKRKSIFDSLIKNEKTKIDLHCDAHDCGPKSIFTNFEV